jgi:iron-sulfur cluster repair protein YtfE (RIC family)
MRQDRSCRQAVPPAPGQARPPVRADQTVADVAQLRAEALETMKALGINHCCGAHLTLSDAAAAAGVPLDALLAALNEPQEARA